MPVALNQTKKLKNGLIIFIKNTPGLQHVKEQVLANKDQLTSIQEAEEQIHSQETLSKPSDNNSDELLSTPYYFTTIEEPNTARTLSFDDLSPLPDTHPP